MPPTPGHPGPSRPLEGKQGIRRRAAHSSVPIRAGASRGEVCGGGSPPGARLGALCLPPASKPHHPLPAVPRSPPRPFSRSLGPELLGRARFCPSAFLPPLPRPSSVFPSSSSTHSLAISSSSVQPPHPTSLPSLPGTCRALCSGLLLSGPGRSRNDRPGGGWGGCLRSGAATPTSGQSSPSQARRAGRSGLPSSSRACSGRGLGPDTKGLDRSNICHMYKETKPGAHTAHTCTHTAHTYTHMHTHRCTHVHTCTRTHMHTQMHTRARRCTHAHTCAHVHMHTQIHMCTHMHTRAHTEMHTRAHTCTHGYRGTETLTNWLQNKAEPTRPEQTPTETRTKPGSHAHAPRAGVRGQGAHQQHTLRTQNLTNTHT